MLRKMMPLAGALLSAALLALCYPSGGLWWLAWLALIPLLLAVEGRSLSSAFGLGWLAGLVFFISTLFWIHHVTPLGLVLLSAYLALYCGAFAFSAAVTSAWTPLRRALFLASLWTALEYARATLLTGFGWSALAHTQSVNLALIQIADITGTYGISFVMVVVNVVLACSCAPGRGRTLPDSATRGALWLAAGLVTTAVVYGSVRLLHHDALLRGPSLRVGLVQGNITLAESWDEGLKTATVERMAGLTRRLFASGDRPQLMIWTETSLPAYIWDHPDLWARVHDLARDNRTDLLVGAVTRQDGHYFNSALWINARGEEAGTYRKQHLVLFGEYIPLRDQLPWLADIVPIDDFTPGRVPAVFATVSGARFSPLICFEDTIPRLARDAVLQGAGFLVNISNDAWFGASREPWMHLDNAVFRCVENRVALARASNTGISAVVMPSGQVARVARDARGESVMVPAALTAVIPSARREGATFYTKYGDVFALSCFPAILGLLLFGTQKSRMKEARYG